MALNSAQKLPETQASSPELALHPSIVRTIVFDLDGTLVDSMDDFSVVAQRLLQQYFGVDEQTAFQYYKETSGLPFEFQLKRLFGDSDERIPQAVADFEKQKMDGYNAKAFYYDVVRTLPLLKQYGYRLCVSSNNHHENVVQKMEPYKDYFDLILGYRPEFFKGKDHFSMIMKEFNLRSDEIVFVGDSLHDCRVSHQNNIPFVARVGTFQEHEFDELEVPHFRIRNFFELIQLLQGEGE